MLRVELSILLLYLNLSVCWCLNSEGLALLRFREGVVSDPFGALSGWGGDGAGEDPCWWFGVECSDGKVIALNLRNLCLKGTLAPELGKLSYIKSIMLRNNSFYGEIPNEIGTLKELEVLDLGYNKFGGFQSGFHNNLSLITLLLDNNEYLDSISPELYALKMLSEIQADENHLVNVASKVSCGSGLLTSTDKAGDVPYRRQMQNVGAFDSHKDKADKRNSRGVKALPLPFASISPQSSPSISLPPSADSPTTQPTDPPSSIFSLSPPPLEIPSQPPAEFPSIFSTPSVSPSPTPTPGNMAPPDSFVTSSVPETQPKPLLGIVPFPAPSPTQLLQTSSKSDHHIFPALAGALGGFIFILFSAIGIIIFRRSMVVSVKPWATGLSGQLQKAFVSGVPQLKRAELEAACEDFSNIVGSLLGGTLYKGTLSNGVEIAVVSTAVKNSKDWSKDLETQFRKKINILSKVNHKNFMNLIGYCVEENPFTRMMVFEYAPNGTLFEHLHVKEAEHLDWAMRLRIAMGMAYCLEHFHTLTPPVVHSDLTSLNVYLTEDYAAKVSDFSFWNNITTTKTTSTNTYTCLEENIYNFGLVLYEMVTGRVPYTEEKGALTECTLDFLQNDEPLRLAADPTLLAFEENELEKLHNIIKSCIHPDPKQRPTMKDIATRLRNITLMGPNEATPKLSPLWWAELEIISEEAS